jgi:pimeloyl-ACP methyl ester carboxylesterase
MNMAQRPLLDLVYSRSYYEELRSLSSDRYSPHIAALSALIAMAAYDDSDEGTLVRDLVAERLLLSPDKVQVSRVNVAAAALLLDTNAFVVSIPNPSSSAGGKIVFVAFRGTEFLGKNFLVDVFTDARAVPVDFPGAGSFVHGGFLNAADLAWFELLRALGPRPSAPNRALMSALVEHGSIDRLYITGHSLGGAIAVLAAARLLDPPDQLQSEMGLLADKLAGVYTFGQPMVGGAAFAQRAQQTGLTGKLFRHVYRADWVPHLPPLTTGVLPQNRYVHFGLELRGGERAAFDFSGKTTKPALTASLSGLTAALPFFFRAIRPLSRLPFVYSVEDHQPEYYWRTSERSLPDQAAPGSVGSQQLRRSQSSGPSAIRAVAAENKALGTDGTLKEGRATP